jgi:hypothetical protein
MFVAPWGAGLVKYDVPVYPTLVKVDSELFQNFGVAPDGLRAAIDKLLPTLGESVRQRTTRG